MTYHHFCVTFSSLTLTLAFLLHFSPTIYSNAAELFQGETRKSVIPEKSIPLRPPARNDRGHIDYKTTYACDGNVLGLSCRPSESIYLVRANYGRFSLSICNDGGKLDLRVNCMSFRSYLIMQDRCSGKSKCNATVSSDSFGDPCPGTPKYLEVQYHCVPNVVPTSSASSPSSSSSSSAASSLVTTTRTRPPTNSALPVDPWILKPSIKSSYRDFGSPSSSSSSSSSSVTTGTRPPTYSVLPVDPLILKPSIKETSDREIESSTSSLPPSFSYPSFSSPSFSSPSFSSPTFSSPSFSSSSSSSSSIDKNDGHDGGLSDTHQRHHHHDNSNDNSDNYNSNSNYNNFDDNLWKGQQSTTTSSSSSTYNLFDETSSTNWLSLVLIIGSGICFLCILFILLIHYNNIRNENREVLSFDKPTMPFTEILTANTTPTIVFV